MILFFVLVVYCMVSMDSGQINQVLGVKKKLAIAHADLSSFRKLFDVILTNDRSLIWLVRSRLT